MQEKYDFADILLEPRLGRSRITSREHIDLTVDGAVPVIVANMDSIGTFAVAQALSPFRIQVAILKRFTSEDWKREVDARGLDARLLIPTLGLRNLDGEIARVREILAAFPDVRMVCLDVANGYLASVAGGVRALRDAVGSDVRVCAGNVVEAEGFHHLVNAGADVVKVGIGSGGACLTRKRTGVGFPQFSAVAGLADLAAREGVALVSDGGIADEGDVAKALAAGASYVMAGSYFAGHEETGQAFHGMSSDRAREVIGEVPADYRTSEGREVVLAPRGPLADTAARLLGGLVSACTYLGVERLEELPQAHLRAHVVRRQLNRIGGVDVERGG